MSEEVELAAKTSGAIVLAVLEASGITKPIQEVTGWLASWMHPRLVASAAKQLEAAAEKLERAGVRPSAVRDEQMRTLLEEGVREEDDRLRDKWANLLANGLAAGADGVPRAYAEVLRQLEPVEARILDAMAEDKGTFLGSNSGTRMGKGKMKDLPLAGLVNLERLGLIALGPAQPTPPGKPRLSVTDALRVMRLTQFGISFIRACQAPKPAESEPLKHRD